MKRNGWLKTLALFGAFVLFLAALFLISRAPPEQTMRAAYYILYFHVPAAWLGLLSYTIIFVSSIAYLRTRKQAWDTLATVAAELGFLFTTLFLISGSIWARPAWGVWWDWNPRLTTGLILWFIYVAYLTVRFYAGEKQQGARFGAVVGIVGWVDVPIVALAATLWSSAHPSGIVFQSGGLTASMKAALMTSIAAFTVLYVFLLTLRLSVKNRENELAQLREALE
jgi:heme exporter protein C